MIGKSFFILSVVAKLVTKNFRNLYFLPRKVEFKKYFLLPVFIHQPSTIFCLLEDFIVIIKNNLVAKSIIIQN